MKRFRVLRYCLFLVLFIPLELLIIFLNSAIWIKLQPPASALLTVPKLIYPNVIDKAAIIYAVIIVALVLVVAFGYINKKHFSGFAKTTLVICLLTFGMSFISSVSYLVIISNVKIEYAVTPVNVGQKSTKVDFKSKDRECINLKNEFTSDQPLTFKLYMPDHSRQVRDIVMYLAYGNWLAVDEQEVNYLVNGLNKKGYGVAVFTGKTRKEADIVGMIQDIRTKIEFLHEHASEYGIGKIYLSGGSAGANLALLTSYAVNCKEYSSDGLTAEQVKTDGVIAFYPVVDTVYNYYYYSGKTEKEESVLDKLGDDFFSLQDVNGAKSISESNKIVMNMLLGGSPADPKVKHLYYISSPINFISKNIPPTLFIQGMHDSMTPFVPTKNMYDKLKGLGADAALLEFPFTDHAFDMIFPEHSVVVKKTLSCMVKWLDEHNNRLNK